MTNGPLPTMGSSIGYPLSSRAVALSALSMQMVFPARSNRADARQGDPPNGKSFGGTTFGVPPYEIWARLLKRVFGIDIEHCPHCGGSLKIIAAIEDPAVIAKILSHLSLPIRAPPRSPARHFALIQTA